jgi:hypothetical protein
MRTSVDEASEYYTRAAVSVVHLKSTHTVLGYRIGLTHCQPMRPIVQRGAVAEGCWCQPS